MNIDNKLDALKRISQVDAPPFLLTRIRQQIENLKDSPAPVKWKWAFAASAIFIVALNITVFFKQNNAAVSNTGIETVVNSMNLSSTNYLYNE